MRKFARCFCSSVEGLLCKYEILPVTIVIVNNSKVITMKCLHSKLILCQFQSETMTPGIEVHSILLIMNLAYCKLFSLLGETSF